MAVKVIGVCLTLSCIFLCALGNLKITEEQFAQFKGTDPTKFCGCQQSKEKFCTSIVKEEFGKCEKGSFKNGFPKCQCTTVEVEKNCGEGQTMKKANVIVCSWENENTYYTCGKGQTENKVMGYIADGYGVCHFVNEYTYSGN